METLKEYVLSRRSPETPTIRPYHSKIGDFISFVWKPRVPFFARRVGEFLTGYYSIETQELVGCKIDSVNFLMGKTP